MDFSVLLKDLRDVAEKYQGKSTEPQVSTHAYVDMFTKILKRAQKVTEQYDDQITVLWVALNQLASIYKDLTAGSARDQLCKFIFGMCAKTVLNIQWAQLDDDSKVKKNFSTTVEDVHKILSQLGFYKFQLILDLMESHWTHPVLSKVMSGEEEDTDDFLEYIQKEDPDILKLRIEIMMKENCEEFALNLCNWSLKHPALQNDLKIKEHQIFILYKQQEYGKMQEVCETIICHDGIKVMSHLAKTPTNQELCIRLAQVFLIQDWVKQERTCCTQELLKLWIHHQYLADKDEERFLDSIWTVAKVCRDTEQIGVLIDGVKKECGDMFIQLYSELCKYAINIDKGNMEREEVQKDREEYNRRRLAMSKTCVRMAFMLKEYDFRISRICGLTAFSLDPTTDNLNLVNKLYWTIKNVSAASQNSKINIATLYEIERLLGQMRPESLNPEYSWKQLIPVCKKYKLDYGNNKNDIPLKKEVKNEHIPSQSSSFEGNKQVTPMPHMLHVVKSDKDVTKKIDTGQKRGRKPKKEVPKDIQQAHLAKLLGQKNLTQEEIEKVLRKEFPRNVTQDFSEAPSLDVKELDRTIDDLKKSIYLETQYRERIKNSISSLQQCKKRNDISDRAASGQHNQHVSRHEMFRQQQQMLHNKNAIQRQRSAPSGSRALGPILHRQLSMGSPQPPNAHSHHRQQQMSPAFGGSPPPAHSTSPGLSSPTGFPMSPPGARPHSACPNILNSGKSGAFSQMHTSQNRSGTVSSQLCNKIKNELQQHSQQTKLMKNSRFNILRPPGNSKQECAKIAQQIAEMHERQRAERERAEKLEHARLQGQIDGVKAALNSRNIPSSSQISDLLSMTFQGNKGQKMTDGQKNVPSIQGTDISQGKNYLKKKIERSASVSSVQNFASPEPVRRSSASMQSPNATSSGNRAYSSLNQSSTSSNNPSPSNRSHSTGRIPDVNHVSSSKESNSSVLVPGEQGWDPSRGIMKQKYYYKPPKDGTGKVSMGDSPLTMKPVYSMIVPKELTNPNRKEDLVKTVTNMMKKFPKGMHSQQETLTSSSQTTVSAPTVVRVQSQSQTSSNQILNADMVNQQLPNNSSSQQGLTSQNDMQNNPSILDNQSSFQPVSSQSVAQNFLEDGLLNLNTLAAASVSVLGQNSSQQQLVGSLQLPQPVQQHQQQQQVFGTSVIESQPMFSPMQSVQQVSVQQVVQQPETILATPLYTMPTTVIPEPVFSPQLASIQPQVDLGMQQPVMQQIIAVQNQPIAMNNTQPFVSVMSQQPAFQVATVEQVNYSGVSQSMTAGMSSSMSGGMTHVTGNRTNNVMDGITQSMAGGISHAVSGEMIQPKISNPVETSPPAVRPLASKQFLAAPELSPALVQQILSSLKKGGARSNQSKSQDGKQTTSKSQKQHSPVISRTHSSVNESVKDTVQQMIVNRSDPAGNQSVNEARQKILELRKQFGQTAASQSDLPELSKVSPNKPVPTSFSNTVATPRKAGGLLERLMSDDQEVNKINSGVKNLPTFLSSSHSNGNITNHPAPTVPHPVVPELVDLGAKEFQLDTILALDNESSITSGNTLQNDQFPHANLATSGTTEANGTPSLVSRTETGLKREQENTSHVKGLQQSEPSAAAVITNNVCSVITDNVCSENLQNSQDQDDKHQGQSSHCQSTYFNANRLGKERENRDVKIQLAGSEEMKLKVNSQQNMQTVCVSCDLKFPSEQHLLDHKKISNCESKWQCAYCKMAFKCSEILKTHEKNYCLKAPSAMVKCCICGVYFQSHEQLKGHLNPKTCTPQNVHKEKSEFVEDIVCGICKRKFDSMNLIKEHVKVGCVKKDNSFSKDRSLHNFNFSVVFRCTNCNFMNLNENIVSKHVEKCKANNTTAELTEMYECNMCEETFCGKEDACRHVSRQCPKLKITNSQRQVQDVYQKLKDGSISKGRSGDSEKVVELKSNMQTAKEKVLADGNEGREKGGERTVSSKEVIKMDKKDTSVKHSKNESNVQKMNCDNVITECNVPKVSVEKTAKGRVKVTAAGSKKADNHIGTFSDKVKLEDKTSTSDESKTKDHGSVKTEAASVEDKIELATQLQKVQRISAENQFLAEFNKIEKRKQAIRMKKQKELEKQKELLEKKEKQLELEKQKKIQEQLEEKEKQKLINEKQEREKHDFEKEKKKYVNSILGTSTLEEKMKETIEKEKKLKKIKSEKVKDGTVKVLDISRHEKKGTKQLKSENIDEVVVENKISESARDESQQQGKKVTEHVANKKKRKIEDDRDSESEILPEEDKVLREHIEISEGRKRKRQRDVLKTENIESTQRKTNKKQRSPQDIRIIRGLRAKRLIKKKKYYMDEMEPIHRDKFRKEEEQEERSQNIIHGMKNKSQINVKTEIKGRDMEPVHREKHKKEVEKDRNPKVENVIKSRDNRNVDKRDGSLTRREQMCNKSIEQDHTNQTKDTKQIYKHLCRFCGLQNKIKSDQNLDVIYHYVQTHKLGFRQANYKYFCNFCNKQFPSTQTIQVKDHVCHNHWEGVLGRVAAGRYDTKVEPTAMNNKSLSPAKTRYSLRVPVKTPVKSNISKKHLRAVALREKCAEKLRRIALIRKNTIIDYTDVDEDSSVPCSSNHSTDTESLSREERIADVNAKIASISHGKIGKDTDLGSEIKDGRRIAPRLARQMVKDSGIKGNKARHNEDIKKSSDIDDSSDMQVVTRSRSSSASSSRSSLIASAKKRKAAIAISARGSSKSRQKQSEGGAKLHTRSGRVVKRPEMDYDKLTESSGLGSGEDNSELEDTDIRKRKSTRIRRLSEKGKSIRGATTDTDESSTEEIKRRVTRRSFSKGQKENDGNNTDSQNLDEEKNVISSKRIRTGQSPVSRLNNESVELRSLKKKTIGKGRERDVKVERVITRQISKNEEESDSETESNYTDIEHAVKMLGLKMTQNAAVRSAESDSESTSEEDGGRDRKYRLRKRHLNKKYRESESSDEEETNINRKFKLKEDYSDFVPSEECNDPFEDYSKTGNERNIKVKGKRSFRIDSFDSGEHEEEIVVKNKKPKTVLIGAEEDDDLNVDYGLCEKKPELYSDSHVNKVSSENAGRNSEEHEDNSKIRDEDESCIQDHDEIICSKARTVLVSPEDEFAGLESSPTKSHEREKSADSEIISESVSEVETEVESNTLPATVMDEDEFVFLKNDQIEDASNLGTNENRLNSSTSSSSKAAFDSEFIKYAETENREEDTDSDSDFQEKMEKVSKKNEGRIEKDPIKQKLKIEIPSPDEDVPVLPPRDYFIDGKESFKAPFENSDVTEERKKSKSLNVETHGNSLEESDAITGSGRPKSSEKSKAKILKSARVVIEDISVVRKALEIENAEKKLIEECEASSCSVRIDRLSKEEIEKHLPIPSNVVEENKEVEIILIQDSDEENVGTKAEIRRTNRKENVQKKSKNNALNENSSGSDQKSINVVEEQYETLIQDIVLDGSFIDQLLVSESFTVNEVIPEQPDKGEDASNLESTECVQIVVENSNNLQDSVLAVDAQCDTTADVDANVVLGSNNVIILIDDNGVENVKNQQPVDTESMKETEEDVWIENAESYAETPKNTENGENNVFKYTIVKSDDIETLNKLDISEILGLSKGECTVVASSLNEASESKQNEIASEGHEIAMNADDLCDKNNKKVSEIIEKAEKSEILTKDKADSLVSHIESNQSEESSLQLTASADTVTEDVKNIQDTVYPDTEKGVVSEIIENDKKSEVMKKNKTDSPVSHIENKQSEESSLQLTASADSITEDVKDTVNPDTETGVVNEITDKAEKSEILMKDKADSLVSHIEKKQSEESSSQLTAAGDNVTEDVKDTVNPDTETGVVSEITDQAEKSEILMKDKADSLVSHIEKKQSEESSLQLTASADSVTEDAKNIQDTVYPDTEKGVVSEIIENDKKSEVMTKDKTDSLVSHIENEEPEELSLQFPDAADNVTEDVKNIQDTVNRDTETEVGKDKHCKNDNELVLEFDKEDLQSQDIPSSVCIQQEIDHNVSTSVEAEIGVYGNEQARNNEDTPQDINKHKDIKITYPRSNITDLNNEPKNDDKEQNGTSEDMQSEKNTGVDVETKFNKSVETEVGLDDSEKDNEDFPLDIDKQDCTRTTNHLSNVTVLKNKFTTDDQAQNEKSREEKTEKDAEDEIERETAESSDQASVEAAVVIGIINNDLNPSIGLAETLKETSLPDIKELLAEKSGVQGDLQTKDIIKHGDEKQRNENKNCQNIETTNRKVSAGIEEIEEPLAVSELTNSKYSLMEKDNVCDTSTESFVFLQKTKNEETDLDKDRKDSVLHVSPEDGHLKIETNDDSLSPEDGHSKIETNDDSFIESSAENVLPMEMDHEIENSDHLEENSSKSEEDLVPKSVNESAVESVALPVEKCNPEVDVLEEGEDDSEKVLTSAEEKMVKDNVCDTSESFVVLRKTQNEETDEDKDGKGKTQHEETDEDKDKDAKDSVLDFSPDGHLKIETNDDILNESSAENVLPMETDNEIENSDHLEENSSKSETNDDSLIESSAQNILPMDTDHEIENSDHLEENSSKSETIDESLTESSAENVLPTVADNEIENSDHLEGNNSKSEEVSKSVNETEVESVTPHVEKCNQEADALEKAENDLKRDLISAEVKMEKDKNSVLDVSPEDGHPQIETNSDTLSESSVENDFPTETDHEKENIVHLKENSSKFETNDDTVNESSAENVLATETDHKIENSDHLEENSRKSETNDNSLIESSAKNVVPMAADNEIENSDHLEENSSRSETNDDTVIESSAESVFAMEADHEIENSDHLEENSRKSETNDNTLIKSSAENILPTATDHEIENSDHLEENSSKSETNDDSVIESSAENVLSTETDHEIENSDHVEENSTKYKEVSESVNETAVESVTSPVEKCNQKVNVLCGAEDDSEGDLTSAEVKMETKDDALFSVTVQAPFSFQSDGTMEKSYDTNNMVATKEGNSKKDNIKISDIIYADQKTRDEQEIHAKEEEAGSKGSNNCQMGIENRNESNRELENKLDFVKLASATTEVKSMTTELSTDLDISVDSANKDSFEIKLDISGSKNKVETCVPSDASSSGDRLSVTPLLTETQDTAVLMKTVERKRGEVTVGTEKECSSGNMQEENLSSVPQPTANLNVPDKSMVCNEVDMVDEKIDRSEKRNNNHAASNLSLLAIQSYSDSDGENESQNVIEEIKTTRNTDICTCIEEVIQSDKQQKLESVTNMEGVNLQEPQIGEGESVETEQLQNEKSLNPDTTETKNTSESEFVPMCVESSHMDIVETLEKVDNSAVVFEENEAHESTCVKCENTPSSVQSSYSVVSFVGNEVENVDPLQVIKESETIKEILSSNEDESKTVVDADSCTELIENDQESANDFSSVVNFDEVDINELRSDTGSGSDRTVEQLKNSSSGTVTNTNLQDTVQTECPVISTTKQNEIHSTVEERMTSENGVNEHIQHGGELDEGSHTRLVNEEKEKYFKNTANVSDINVEDAESGKAMDSFSQLSVKNENDFQSSSDKMENKILMLDDADSNLLGSICITNSETLQRNMHAGDALQTDKEQMLKCKVTDSDENSSSHDVLQPDMLEGDLSEAAEGKSEHDINDSSKGDNEIVKSDADFSKDNVPSCIQEKENVLSDVIIQKTFENEKESVDQLKVEFEQLKNDVKSVHDLDAGPENTWIVVDECSGSSDNDHNIEIDSKNPMLRTLRQVSVSSSSDISLISFPEYETEHSEESNDKRENLIEIKSTENADIAITDEVRDSENDLTSQEESKPESSYNLEQKQIEPIAELPEEIPVDTENHILETECSANSSYPLEITRDNLIPENVIKEAKVGVNTEMPSSHYEKINEVNHDECKNSSYCTNDSGVTVNAGMNQGIVVEGANDDLDIESYRVNVNSGMNQGIVVEGTKVHEITSTDDSDSSKNSLEATLDNDDIASDDLCQVNQEKTEVKVLDNINKIQEPELQENHAHEIPSANEKDGLVSDKNLECDEIERKIENPRKADSDSFRINEMEANDFSIEPQEISHVTKNLDEVALSNTKSTGEGISNVRELTSSVRETRRQSMEQSEQTESRNNNKRQRTKSVENVEEKKGLRNTRWNRSRSKALDSTDRTHLSSRGDQSIVKHKQTSNDEKDLLENEKMASSNVIKMPVDNNGGNSVSVKEAANLIHTSGRESEVSKNVSETNITIDEETTKIETEKGQNTTVDNKETNLSGEMIESEEDPTLDKWVKEIISKETEEKREVFEMPSPRRKGMIVGATCLHKKPENPFVDTRSFKKDGSPRKEVNVGNQTGTRKAYEGKDEIKVNQNKKLQCLEGSKKKIVGQSERIRERSTRVEMSKRVQKDLKSKSVRSDTNQTTGGSRSKVSSKSSIKKVQREENHNKNNVDVVTKDKTSANTHRETKVEQVCHIGKDLSKKTDSNKTLNTSPVVVQDMESKNRKTDDTKSGDQKNARPKPTENSTKTVIVKKAEVKQNLTSSSKCHLKQKSEILVEKSTGGKINREGNGNEELQREDETDEEFRRRLETVRCARRKSAMTPYESDFNFEENENNAKVKDTKVAFSTSFWPSESENNLENFDTASLFSSSSGSSANTGGVKDGKLNVIARCARDFGKDELVKQKIIQLPRPNVVPVFTCSSPEKTTVSTMAVKIVKTMGRSIVNTVPSPVKYTRQQCSTPVISTKIKVLDKNVLSNTHLPARIMKVTAFKSLPKVQKSVTITPTNIDTTLKKLTKQANISKKAQAEKGMHGSSMQREKTKKLNEVRKLDKNTQQSIAGQTNEIPQQEGFEPTDETLSNKVKALRALHKSDKPFKWENSPSPPKNLRSQSKSSENPSADDPNKESISTEQEPKNKPGTRKTREKTLKHAATQKNLRENRKKSRDDASKKGSDKKDISGKKQTVGEERKKRQREPDTTEQDVNLRRTRSRSGSKDKTKFTEEKNDIKQKQEVTLNNKKQIQDKVETENSGAKASVNSLRTETRNTSVKNKSSMKLRHCSDESEKEHATEPILNAEKETSEKSKEVKTRVQKRKSEVENVKEPEQISDEEPAVKVCKLDGTSNSPEKSEVPKCAHKLNIPGCDHCTARQSENPKFGKEPVRPAVRQIIHRGRVFEIQRGCVTETDIQDFTTKPRSVINETTSTSSEDQMKKRSRRVNERRKRAHSPEDIVDINMKDKGTEFGMNDINKYISQTLRDIKKQREGNSNTKWTVRQKKSTKEAFPYYFKKANSKL